MLTFTKGDMFAVTADIRVNTVNCVGVMGAGVALAFKKKYPEMYEHYKRECSANKIRPGYLDIWEAPDGVKIINFPTKRHWKEKSRYEDIEVGLIALSSYLRGAKSKEPLRMTLPALGCGHGGLDWSIVSSMISKHLDNIEAEILIFEPSVSVSIGKAAKAQDNQEVFSQLASQGVLAWQDVMDSWPVHRMKPDNAERIFLFGNTKILMQEFVCIVSSNKPSHKEFMAATVCIENIAKTGIVLALPQSGKLSSKLCHLALSQGACVILGFAEGIARYKLQKGLEKYQRTGQLCVVSIGDPSDRWSPSLARRTITMLTQSARALVLTSQFPDDFLFDCFHAAPSLQQKFYIKYQETTPVLAEKFSALGMRPIGRNAATGLPNMVLVSAAVGQKLNPVRTEDSTDDDDSHAKISSRDSGIHQPLALFARDNG